MKKASRAFLSLVVALSYVFACMGFGIHVCHEDGSRHFVWMLGEVSCEHIHHHSHEADHDHHHDGGCCSTHVFVLTEAQDCAPDTADLSAPEMTLPLLLEGEPFLPMSAERTCYACSDTPPLISPPALSFLSVWLV